MERPGSVGFPLHLTTSFQKYEKGKRGGFWVKEGEFRLGRREKKRIFDRAINTLPVIAVGDFTSRERGGWCSERTPPWEKSPGG